MEIGIFSGKAAAIQHGRARSVKPGTHLPCGAPTTPLVRNRELLDAGLWTTQTGAPYAVGNQLDPRKNQHMTRIAAAGGSVSGSQPAWDPV